MKETAKTILLITAACSILVVIIGFFIPSTTDRIAITKMLNHIILILCVGFIYLGEKNEQ